MTSIMVSSGLPMLKECCCGCSLKTGSMIIGFITMIWASILTYMAIMSLINGNYVIVSKDSNIDTVLESCILGARTLQAIFSLFLIIATHKENAGLILPWLVVALVVVMMEGAYLATMASHLAIGDLNPRIVSLATHVSVTVYFFFVVYSYYRQVRDVDRGLGKA
ncbi:uncharacterized protein LOC128986665 [Macrosteles quadrilineatus]|uniref:uncharacterized protein LOC128986665 n=1 Tax=Macrosteles quadrilineatus TaxID=74068 RepID=UPI0023E157DE|nr:uncharacterized protein LOC128986665 [Macrosteles quadrilineatus]XP_054263121.1 uncharacterized protein LOC128986665 [Macrosteles quadrilineatus]